MLTYVVWIEFGPFGPERGKGIEDWVLFYGVVTFIVKELCPVRRDYALYKTLGSREVIVENDVKLRGDEPCTGAKYEWDVRSMLRGMT